MKQYCYILSILLIIKISLHPVLFAQKNTNTIDTLYYGFDETYEPYEYYDQEGLAKGFNIDLITAVAEQLELPLKLNGDKWTVITDKFEAGDKINVMAYFKSEERMQKVKYTKPFGVVYYSIFSRTDESEIDDLLSLFGKTVAIQKNTIVEEYFDQFGFLEEESIRLYDSEKEALKAVIDGKADCAITSYFSTNYNMQANKYKGLKSSSDPIFITEYCFAVDKENEALLMALNYGLKLVKATGKYDQLYQKWFTPKESWLKRNAFVIKIALLILLVLIALVSSWIYLLRRQLERKSKKIKLQVEQQLEVEADLRESELLRKKTEEFSSIMILEQDLDHKIKLAPSSFSQLLFLKNKDRPVNRSIHEFMSEKDIENDIEIKKELISGARKFIDTEIELKNGKKGSLWVKCSTSIIYNKNGEPVGYLQFLRDLTPLKKANLTLLELNAELANFMYKTSHDVRGPIANILGLTGLGKMVSKDNELTHYFDLVENSAKKLEHIFDDFKEVSFILHGDIGQTNFSFKALCEEVLESVFRKRNKDLSQAHIIFSIAKNYDIITTDRTLLKRFIYQIIENAFEHNTYYNTSVKIELRPENNQYHLSFTDDGIGIPKEIHAKVFELFFKGKRTDINIGMGLYIAKKVILKLGGELVLESGINQGTRIIAIIPELSND